ncbi:GNAT family N-acetyltransferase [Salibacterium aidingense]|uniref:GNAT family N-acetyltransferase n=1 Tax=Salibacterium aidingense TaxID=384933 RepID=UPI003BCC2414
MFLLPQHQFMKVKPLFDSFHHQIITMSVLEGNTVGDIYVDDLDNPTSALLNGMNFEVLFAGDPHNKTFNEKIIHVITGHIMPKAKNLQLPAINLYYNNEQWKQVIEQEVTNKIKSSKVEKRFYTFDIMGYNPYQKTLPDNASLKLIDASLFNDSSLNNLNQVRQWVQMPWRSVDHFLQKGVGYCVIEEDTVAGWCLSVFSSGNQLEFALMTEEGYRKKGYAKIAASACINFCIENGKSPLWNCDDKNIPSILVAESIGFKRTLNYNIYQIKID